MSTVRTEAGKTLGGLDFKFVPEFKVGIGKVQEYPGAEVKESGRVCVYQLYRVRDLFGNGEWSPALWHPIDYFDTQ